MTVLLFITSVFATLRISVALGRESGPFGIFEKFRTAVSNRLSFNHWLAVGIGCPKCISFWIASILAIGVSPATVPAFIVDWLAIAGGAYVLIELIQLYEVSTLKE